MVPIAELLESPNIDDPPNIEFGCSFELKEAFPKIEGEEFAKLENPEPDPKTEVC